jgi:hypothetical protein
MDRHDRPDDSNQNRHPQGSVNEEAMDDEQMEDKGARENQAGKDRQRRNNAV